MKLFNNFYIEAVVEDVDYNEQRLSISFDGVRGYMYFGEHMDFQLAGIGDSVVVKGHISARDGSGELYPLADVIRLR